MLWLTLFHLCFFHILSSEWTSTSCRVGFVTGSAERCESIQNYFYVFLLGALNLFPDIFSIWKTIWTEYISHWAYIGGALMCRSGPGEWLKLLDIYLHQALEKNQQWLTYDQQREAYVQSVLTRLMELEQQAKQQQTKREDAADGGSMKGSIHWNSVLGYRKHRSCCFIQCFGLILSTPAKAVWLFFPPILHVCLTRLDWEFIHVLPNMSRSCSSCQFIREGRSGEEPLRTAAVGGAERPGKPQRSSRQSPAGAEHAEGTGECSQCAVLYYYSTPASALRKWLLPLLLRAPTLRLSWSRRSSRSPGCSSSSRHSRGSTRTSVTSWRKPKCCCRQSDSAVGKSGLHQKSEGSDQLSSRLKPKRVTSGCKWAGRIKIVFWLMFFPQTWVVRGEEVVVRARGEDEDGTGGRGRQVRGEEEEMCWTSTGGATTPSPKMQRLNDLNTKWITNPGRSLTQVNLLQRSLLKQSEEQRRTAALEQQVLLDSDWFQSGDMSPRLRTKEFLALASLQILLSTKDFENEKLDRQNMQHQLQKVLKELRKARDQISKLESAVSVCCKLLFFEPVLLKRWGGGTLN